LLIAFSNPDDVEQLPFVQPGQVLVKNLVRRGERNRRGFRGGYRSQRNHCHVNLGPQKAE